MDASAYWRWWQLHLRMTRGEALGPEEEERYAAGWRELDESEVLESLGRPRQARQELRALEREFAELEQSRRELDDEIAALERMLPRPIRQALGIEE